jgi:hypothetical protein
MHPAPGYEWTVHVININAGNNKGIMDRCEPLKAYAVFVQRVRDNRAAGMELRVAIKEAVDYCIKQDLLAGYFAENRGRVEDMMWSEYNARIHEENLKNEGRMEMLTDMILSMLKRKKDPSYIAEDLEVSLDTVLSTAKAHNIPVVQ